MTSRPEAVAAFGMALAAHRAEMARLYAEGGARAVAEAACPNGSEEQIAALAALYEGWVQEARAKGKRAASAA